MTSGAITTRKTHCASSRSACTSSDLIKTEPTQCIADGTDWRFLNEIKRELKA